MIKLGCDKSGDSRILLVENKFLNIHCQTCYTSPKTNDARSYESARAIFCSSCFCEKYSNNNKDAKY